MPLSPVDKYIYGTERSQPRQYIHWNVYGKSQGKNSNVHQLPTA